MQQRHPAPHRRCVPTRRPVLQIKIAHRQRHDGDAGLGNLGNRALLRRLVLHRQHTAMAGEDLAAIAGLEHRLGQMLERLRARVVGLVSVEVDIEPELARLVDEPQHRLLGAIEHRHRPAHQPTRRLGAPRHGIERLGVDQHIGADQRHRLQLDPSSPGVADLFEQRPRDIVLRRDRVEMRADRCGAVRVGGAQRKIHPPPDVHRRPQAHPVAGDRQQRRQPRAVRVLLARPDLALVEMRVDVDERRQHQAAIEVTPGPRLRRRQRGDPVVGNRDVQPLDAAARAPKQCRRHRCVAKHVHQFSRRTALSCQRCSTAQVMNEVIPKIATPVTVSSTSAA